MPVDVSAACWTGWVPMSNGIVMRVSDLLARTPSVSTRALLSRESDPIVTSMAFDSRDVVEGALFFCLPGEHADGHRFAAAAVAAGAVALVVERPVDVDPAITQIVVDNARVAMAHLASAYFANPSEALTVIGVTGTNGKTTTAHILSGALGALGRRTGVIGTLSGAKTTPEAPDLQRRLAGFVAGGYDAVAMEVSSHALALDRALGTRFRIAVFTNLGHDHLEFHGTPERYFAAKARLFEPDLSDRGVVNIDDVHGRLLVDAAAIPCQPFSFADAADVEIGPFSHAYTWRGQRVEVGLGGRFNVMNTLAAATALSELGHSDRDITVALAATTSVPGRFEPVVAGQPFAVVVDYAHTPDALVEVLDTARSVGGNGRVIVVFGCGGDRDQHKRPEMGAVAAARADLVVVTSDNPRSEDPLAIINDVIAGVPANYRDRIAVEPDRHDAIAIALAAARDGDVVVIAGKGHETTQTFGATAMPFDDRAVARELLEARP
jgi:UDP-N-acetylmuramoyl-L-alanyl-D-glutamate--2,6-diaminopimelate ligase